MWRKPWGVTSFVMPAAATASFSRVVIIAAQMGFLLSGEEDVARVGTAQMSRADLGDVAIDPLKGARADRDESVLAAFAFANDEDTAVDVDVVELQRG